MPLIQRYMQAQVLNELTDSLRNSEKMPLLFLGHGSPMNAIEENVFVSGFRQIGKMLPRPQAILCISAHWETQGTFVTAMERPRTIHDFGGFPKALYDVQYPAAGSPALALETQQLIRQTQVQLDHAWGLDHGAWSVVKHLFPEADVPIVQMSLDYTQPAHYHYKLAQELAHLRQKGVLIIGSGNLVHNLRMVAWDKLQGEPFGFDWALEANEKMKSFILRGEIENLINYHKQGEAFQLAIPTPEHYLPLLYPLALLDKQDHIHLFNDQALGGSLSMTSVFIGKPI